MALTNREKDPSEQRDCIQWNFGSQGSVIGISTVIPVINVPYPCALQSIRAAHMGSSATPQLAFFVSRFVPGTGLATFAVSISNMVLNALSLSGMVGYSGLAAPGSTLLNLNAGDVLTFVTSAANSAITAASMNLVVKKLQDIVSLNGTSS